MNYADAPDSMTIYFDAVSGKIALRATTLPPVMPRIWRIASFTASSGTPLFSLRTAAQAPRAGR